MTAPAKTRYRAPTVHESVKVSLSDFSDEDIAEYLRHQGYAVVEGEPEPDDSGADDTRAFLLSGEECDRLYTLALCGQQQAAREWLVERMGEHIGRSLK